MDLLLVALLQVTSYRFHDPVLTDRAFVTPPRRMVIAYLVGGLLAGAVVVLYSLPRPATGLLLICLGPPS